MRMEQQAIQDPLTGLYNRRFLNERFQEETDRARRYKSPFTVILFTVPYLTNPEHSIPIAEGDLILRKSSECLVQNSRKIDVLARFGNTEFIALLPETSIGGAEIYARNVMERVDQLDIDLSIPKFKLQLHCIVSAFAPESDTNYYVLLEKLLEQLASTTPEKPLLVLSRDPSSSKENLPFK